MRIGNGRFVIHRKLGTGGMGVVYEAVDRERGAAVALKTLQQVSPARVARFKREFRSLADVVHPNLVSLYELFADENEIFFTMELVQGAHFSHFVRPSLEGAPLEPSESLHFSVRTRQLGPQPDDQRWGEVEDPSTVPGALVPPAAPSQLDLGRLRLALRQLAEGVAAIHDAGMLHRDLKPSNVMVTQSGRVVVLDFGLASALADEGRSGEERLLEGTVAFMSPEQAACTPLTAASDWYSVGAMLYHALTGRPPFVGNRDDMIMAKLQYDPPRPVTVNADVPLDLDDLTMRLLARDPARRPTAAALLSALGADAPTRSHVSLAATPTASESLFGREAQLAALRTALLATRNGAPALAHVHGPSGMGKTRLLRGFLEQAAGEGALVLQGRCYERESMPFKALDSLVDALARHLMTLQAMELEGLAPRDSVAVARLFPVLRQLEAFTSARRRAVVAPDPQELRRRAFAAMREVMARLADQRPLVLAIDDVQWGDADSAQLLASLLRPPDAPAALVVLGHRAEDAADSEFLRELAGQAAAGVDVREIEVGPLAPDDARRLARLHLQETRLGDEELARLVRESQGIPYFVEELARAAREDRPAESDAPDLTELLRARLARLSEPAARLLSTIAVTGRPLAEELATRAAEVDDPAMVQVLKAAGLVRTRLVAGTRMLETYHDRVRQAAAAMLGPAELRERHRRLAVVYEASLTPDLEALAQHLAGAGEPRRAAEFALQAARRAEQALAFERAAQLYRLALELDASRGRLVQTALGGALANAGRGAEAADALLAAVGGASPAEALDLRGRAAGQLLYAGHIDRGLTQLREILGQIGMTMAPTPGRAVTRLLWGRAGLALRGLSFHERHEAELPATQLMKVDVAFSVAEGLGTADPIRAAEFHVRHLKLALAAGEPRRVARALAAEAVFLSLRGVKAAGRANVLRARVDEMAARLGDPSSLGLSAGCRGVVALNEGRFRDAIDALGRAEEIFRNQCIGHRWELATCHIYSLFATALLGRVREVTEKLPVLFEEASSRGDLYTATTLQAALGFYLPLTRDDPDAAYRAIEAALARWSINGFHLQHANALSSQLQVDLYAGEPARALARVRAAWPAVERALLLRVEVMRSLLVVTRGRVMLAEAARSGDKALLAEAERLGRRLCRERADHAASGGWTIRAGCAVVRGDTALALRLFAEAEVVTERAQLVLNLAALRHTHGRILGGEAGARMVADAELYMRAEGLANPARIAFIYAPAPG